MRGPGEKKLDVDADIARARMPPREFYDDPAWLAALRDPLFAAAWHPVDHRDFQCVEQRAAAGARAITEVAVPLWSCVGKPKPSTAAFGIYGL